MEQQENAPKNTQNELRPEDFERAYGGGLALRAWKTGDWSLVERLQDPEERRAA